MDMTSVVKPDVYRVLVVILVPGFVATAPWLSGVFWPALRDARTWIDMVIPIGMTGFCLCLVVGLILENIGSALEVNWADEWIRKEYPRLAGNWNSYLQQKTDGELIAQRYIRVFVTRYKFELSMVPALLVSMAGFAVAHYFDQGLTTSKTFFLVGLMAVVTWWLLQVTLSSALVLAKTRGLVIRALKAQQAAPKAGDGERCRFTGCCRTSTHSPVGGVADP